MADKFLEALNAEIEFLDRTAHLSEEEQIKADEAWEKSKEHKTLKAYVTAAVLSGEK